MPARSLLFKTQLDEALARATHAESVNERHLLGLIGEIANAAEPPHRSLLGHSWRVCRLARRVAEQLDLPAIEIERTAAAALFHDAGKVRIDQAIWAKPTSLDAAEFKLVKMHPIYGAEMMRAYAPLETIISGIELHHEALDGSGYPYQLSASDIPLIARVTTIADAFDAMTSTREYQAAITPEAALHTLRTLAGVKFDSDAVDALCTVMRGCGDDAAPPLMYESVVVRTA